MQDILRRTDIPPLLRICAGTDGSVTRLLEVFTGKNVKVETIYQRAISATSEIAVLLDIEPEDDVNDRLVTLKVDDIVYVLAKSLAPVNRVPKGVRDDLLRADIPIGKILRAHKLETRRDILNMEITHREFFGRLPVLSREYKIIHRNAVLMWINECFPVDDRWKI